MGGAVEMVKAIGKREKFEKEEGREKKELVCFVGELNLFAVLSSCLYY